MSFLDTLLVRSKNTDDYPSWINLRATTGFQIVGAIDGLFAPGERRGDHDVIPGRHGVLGTKLPVDKYVITVPIMLTAATRGERNDALRDFGAAMTRGNGGLITLKRRIATGSGGSYAEHTADGQFITGLSLQLLNPTTGSTELQFYNLSGRWWTGVAWTTP